MEEYADEIFGLLDQVRGASSSLQLLPSPYMCVLALTIKCGKTSALPDQLPGPACHNCRVATSTSAGSRA